MQTLNEQQSISNNQMKIEQNVLNQSQSNFDFDKIKEFNSKSVDLIFDDKIEGALDILKKIEVFLEANAIEAKTNLDKKILIIILHNLACCYQKTKDFENCISYLEAVIYHFDTSLEPKHKIKINEDYFIKSINQDQSTYSLLGDFILELRFSAKFHLQMCAVLSQAGRNVDALSHAKLAALMCEDNLIKTYHLYYQMKDKGITKRNNNSAKNNDDDYPMFAEKIKKSYKIIKDLFDRVISIRGKCIGGNNNNLFKGGNTNINMNINSNQNSNSILTTNGNNTISNHINTTSNNKRNGKNSNSFIDSHNQQLHSLNTYNNTTQSINNCSLNNCYDSYLKYRSSEISTYNSNTYLINNIRNVFGSCIKKEDWIQLLNIGNIMYLSALNYEDLDLDSDPKYELLRDAILEKVVMLTVAYFCIATELRFLSTDKNNSKTNGEFYHYKAVEFASLFLPVSCPIVKHYIYSYYKHYGNDLSIIPEGGTLNMKIELLRSEIEQDKDTLTFITTKKIGYTPNINANLISVQSDINNKNKKEFNLLKENCIITKGKIDGDKAPKFKLDFASLNKVTTNSSHMNSNLNSNNTNVNKRKDESSSLSGPSGNTNTNKENIILNKKENNKETRDINNLLLGLKPKTKDERNKAPNFKLHFKNIMKPNSYGINDTENDHNHKETFDLLHINNKHKEYECFQHNNLLANKSKISEEKAPKFHLNFMNINNTNVNNDNKQIKQNKKKSCNNKVRKKSETARIKTSRVQSNKNSPFYCANNSSSSNNNNNGGNSVQINMNRTSTSKQRAETDRLKINKMQLSKGNNFYKHINNSNYNNGKPRGSSISKKKGNFTDRGISANINKKCMN